LGLTFFELYRRNTAGRVVTAFGVVEHLDVMKDIGTGILTGWVDLAADPLTLEQLEENIRSVEVTLRAEVLAEINAMHDDLPNPCP
jgi:hypothetical protein